MKPKVPLYFAKFVDPAMDRPVFKIKDIVWQDFKPIFLICANSSGYSHSRFFEVSNQRLGKCVLRKLKLSFFFYENRAWIFVNSI